MKLTVHLKKRWITSVLKEAEKTPHPMPWHVRKDRVPGGKPIPSMPATARTFRT